ncbi:MAG: hypothetical protein U0457_04625 [Candidatus Sericytochromatia bacterium]
MKKSLLITIIILGISNSVLAQDNIPKPSPTPDTYINRVKHYLSNTAIAKYIRSFKKETKKNVSVFGDNQGVDSMFLKMNKNKDVNMKKVDEFKKDKQKKLQNFDKEIQKTINNVSGK